MKLNFLSDPFVASASSYRLYNSSSLILIATLIGLLLAASLKAQITPRNGLPSDLRYPKVIVSGTLDTSYKRNICTSQGQTTNVAARANTPVIVIKRKFIFWDACKDRFGPDAYWLSAPAYFSTYNVDEIDGKPAAFFKDKTVTTQTMNIRTSTTFGLSFSKEGSFASPSRVATARTIVANGRERTVQVVEYYELEVNAGVESGEICLDGLPCSPNPVRSCPYRFYVGASEFGKNLGVIVPLFFCFSIGG